LRVVSADGVYCGRVKDLYFDDQRWVIRYVVVALEPRRFGQKRVLLVPEQIRGINVDAGFAQLAIEAAEVASLRLASSVLPVCKQYASIALGSPGAAFFSNTLNGVDPHLRSAGTVIKYRLNLASEFAGILADLLLDANTWEIRYLKVEQVIDARKLQFHLLPQSVERFTWSTERVLLRELQPVELAEEEPAIRAAQAA